MNFHPQPILIENFKTKKLFSLEPLVSSKKDTQKLIQDIFKCCSEDLIYKTLFQDRHPDGYTLENATGFLEYSEKGWSDQTHFIFGIFNHETSELVGAIDIKSPNKDKAEVGYWLSKNYSGLMTNALKAITEIAKNNGYKSLEIYTEISNEKSEAVVKRAGFEYIETKQEEGETRKYHLLNLN